MEIDRKHDNSRLRADIGLDDFIPVKIRSLFPGRALPCDFYFPTILEDEVQIQHQKILTLNDPFSEDDYLNLLERGYDEVYIKAGDEQIFTDYLVDQTQKVVKSPGTPSERKTQLLYDNAELVVKKVFRGPPFEPSIAAGKRVVENFAAHILSERVTAKALFSIFSRDYHTFTHCIQVAVLGMYFGKYLGWSRAAVGEFGLGALFHDLGKNTISSEILNKAGKLDKRELEIIRQHPFAGYQQLRKTKAFTQNQLLTILYHHEALDGSGYPEGLTGNAIPRFARVAHIVDVFDALTSRRVYKEALLPQEALAVMKSEMLGTFDTKIFQSFVKYIEGGDSPDSPEVELKAGLGTFTSVQCETLDKRAKSILVGLEAGDYIILRISDHVHFQRLQTGLPLVIRYVFSGEVYGFHGKILELVQNPAPLILVTYPQEIEKLNLRCEQRQESFLPATLEVRGDKNRCVTADLSYRGCRVFIKQAYKNKLPAVVIGEPIIVCIDLPGREEAVSLRGQIRNEEKTREGDYIGIQFAEASEQVADQWKNFIDDIFELTVT